MHEQTDASLAVSYVVATIVAVITVAGAAAVYLAAAQQQPAQVEAGSDSFTSAPLRHKSIYMDAVCPPVPHHRMSIDMLRRRYQSDEARAACDGSGAGTNTVAPHSHMDSMELDTDTVAELGCAGVNRILSCVPAEELEKHRLVLNSFNWDLDVLMEREFVTSISEH